MTTSLIATIHSVFGHHEGLDANERATEGQNAVVDTRFFDASNGPRASPPHTNFAFLEGGEADIVAVFGQGDILEFQEPLGSGNCFGGVQVGFASFIDVAGDAETKEDRGHVVGIAATKGLVADQHIAGIFLEFLGLGVQVIEIHGIGGKIFIGHNGLIVDQGTPSWDSGRAQILPDQTTPLTPRLVGAGQEVR